MALGIGLAMTLMALVLAAPDGGAASGTVYNSPHELSWSPDGKLLAVADRTAKAVVFIDAASGKVVRQASLNGRPGSVAWAPDSAKVYVSEYETGAVAEVSAADAKVLRRLNTGPRPAGIALAAKKQLLLSANTAMGDVSIIDLASGQEKAKVKVSREPFHISITADEKLAVVSNLLPAGPASDPQTTSTVSLIDLDAMKNVGDIKLPPNSSAVRHTAISPDGKWAYAVHTVGRTTLPTTQLERGWINTNALTYIDLTRKEHFATMLMDTLSEGAADPWGIALDKDGKTMWVSIAGNHQVARIDLAGLDQLLQIGAAPPATKPAAPAADPKGGRAPATPSYQSVWNDIKANPAKRADLVNDLAALYVGGVINRVNIAGKAPRGISISPDGKQLAVAMYFTGKVFLLDPATCKVTSQIALGPEKQPDLVRKGDQIFHDAHYAFQHWLSCATCHPNEARVDGFNWDLMNDGIGNPKNAKSLLWSHKTPPAMWLGVRDTMETAAMAGFRFAAFQPQDEDVKAVQAYLKSLEPDPSPYLVNGQLSEKAKRGKLLFDSPKTGCATCHPGPLYTNLKQYNVASQGEFDHKEQDTFDTPTLVELWRTGPFLHDGRAATLHELFTKHNAKDQHGKTSQLTKEELDDLVEYLLSL